MTAPEPCIHDLDPAHCAVCNGAEKRAAAERARERPEAGRRGPWFTARHDGKCSDCGEPFDAGTMIRADGDGGWLCEDCGDSGP